METNNSKKILDIFADFLPNYFRYINSSLHRGVYKGINFNENQIKVMMAIDLMTKLNPSHLSTALNIQKGSLTTIIKSLISMGYIRKEYDPDDDRKYYLYLTNEGKDFVEDRKRRNAENFEELFSDISDHECEKILEGISTLNKYLRKK